MPNQESSRKHKEDTFFRDFTARNAVSTRSETVAVVSRVYNQHPPPYFPGKLPLTSLTSSCSHRWHPPTYTSRIPRVHLWHLWMLTPASSYVNRNFIRDLSCQPKCCPENKRDIKETRRISTNPDFRIYSDCNGAISLPKSDQPKQLKGVMRLRSESPSRTHRPARFTVPLHAQRLNYGPALALFFARSSRNQGSGGHDLSMPPWGD